MEFNWDVYYGMLWERDPWTATSLMKRCRCLLELSKSFVLLYYKNIPSQTFLSPETGTFVFKYLAWYGAIVRASSGSDRTSNGQSTRRRKYGRFVWRPHGEGRAGQRHTSCLGCNYYNLVWGALWEACFDLHRQANHIQSQRRPCNSEGEWFNYKHCYVSKIGCRLASPGRPSITKMCCPCWESFAILENTILH